MIHLTTNTAPAVTSREKLSSSDMQEIARQIAQKAFESIQTPAQKVEAEKLRKVVAARYGNKAADCLYGVALTEMAELVSKEGLEANAQQPSFAPDPATYFAPKAKATSFAPDPAKYFKGY